MQTTFLNGDSNLKEKGFKYYSSRRQDFEGFMRYGFSSDDINDDDESAKDASDFFDSVGDFFDYGLSFDFVDAGTFDDQTEGYYRFQLSWGGSSDEIRFYHDGRIEYVYLDWGVGVGFDVSYQDWAQWLKFTLEELQSICWEDLSPEQIELMEYEDDSE